MTETGRADMTRDPLTVEDALRLVEDQAQWMREDGPADMRDMLGFVRSVRRKVLAGVSRDDIIASCARDDDEEGEG